MSYLYEGDCPERHIPLELPRTPQVEELARELMGELGTLEEGKMFGVMLAEGPDGTLHSLKAFSGLWRGLAIHPGWASPLAPPRVSELETWTLARLQIIKDELERLEPELQAYPAAQQEWEEIYASLCAQHKSDKKNRQVRRLEGEVETLLGQESREQSNQRRDFRRRRDATLDPLRKAHEKSESRVLALKRERRAISRTLQKEMHEYLDECLFGEVSWSLGTLFPGGAPTGTGDCCAPKLLWQAYREGLKPLSMAEFWWGPSSIPGRKAGEFTTACKARCQPLLGALLSMVYG